MRQDDERAALVALLRATARWRDVVGEVVVRGGAYEALRQYLSHEDSLFPEADGIDGAVAAAREELEAWRSRGIGVHTFFDDDFPERLRGIREMPPILFSRGALIEERAAVAVVGTRQASERGLEIATTVARSLAGHGVTVVSGLAACIDTAAHQAALEAGARPHPGPEGSGARPPGDPSRGDPGARLGPGAERAAGRVHRTRPGSPAVRRRRAGRRLEPRPGRHPGDRPRCLDLKRRRGSGAASTSSAISSVTHCRSARASAPSAVDLLDSACAARAPSTRTWVAVADGSAPPAGTILLLDDTWTTGSCVQAASRALKRAGAERVAVVILGRWLNPEFEPTGPILNRLKDAWFALETCAAHAPAD